MKSAIKDLYYGTTIPRELPAPDSVEYKEAVAKLSKLSVKLEDMLNDEQLEVLNEYLVVHSTVATLTEEQKYKDGFIMAGNLMNEIYQTKERSIYMKYEETVLDQICNGNLDVADAPIHKTQEHEADERELAKLRNQLDARLDEESRDIFANYVTLALSIAAYVSQEKLKDGLALGMQLNGELKGRSENF